MAIYIPYFPNMEAYSIQAYYKNQTQGSSWTTIYNAAFEQMSM